MRLYKNSELKFNLLKLDFCLESNSIHIVEIAWNKCVARFAAYSAPMATVYRVMAASAVVAAAAVAVITRNNLHNGVVVIVNFVIFSDLLTVTYLL